MKPSLLQLRHWRYRLAQDLVVLVYVHRTVLLFFEGGGWSHAHGKQTALLPRLLNIDCVFVRCQNAWAHGMAITASVNLGLGEELVEQFLVGALQFLSAAESSGVLLGRLGASVGLLCNMKDGQLRVAFFVLAVPLVLARPASGGRSFVRAPQPQLGRHFFPHRVTLKLYDLFLL